LLAWDVAYLANMILLWYKRAGLIFKKDGVYSANIDDIAEMNFPDL